MAVVLSDTVRQIIDDTNFAALATVNADGSPQNSFIWITRDGDDLLMATLIGRRKERNMRRDPRVSVCVFDRDNPYRYVEVRGTVTMTEEGGRELINELSHKYVGKDYTSDGPGDVRVVVRLTPQHVTGMNLG